MFKIAFPWAHHAEEKAERDYLKTFDATSQDEVAGNVWVEPSFGEFNSVISVHHLLTAATALELASDYGMVDWIRALLDPTEILQSPSSQKKQITAPPKFDLNMEKVKLSPPGRTPGRGSTRLRSQSPSKIASPVKSKASPRKRQTKAQKEAAIANANAASATLQSALDDAASVAGSSTAVEAITPSSSSPLMNGEEMVKVKVDQKVDTKDNTETTRTNITVEMPAGSPELPLPSDTEKMLETAKKMVEEAKALESSPKIARKRKVEEVEPSDLDAELPAQPAKKARVLEEKLKREKVRTRAFVGMTVTLAIA
jgi:hypothetical protein